MNSLEKAIYLANSNDIAAAAVSDSQVRGCGEGGGRGRGRVVVGPRQAEGSPSTLAGAGRLTAALHRYTSKQS